MEIFDSNFQINNKDEVVFAVPVALISNALLFSFLVSSKFFKAWTCIELGFISAKSKFWMEYKGKFSWKWENY